MQVARGTRLPLVMAEGHSGYCVDPGDLEAFCDAVHRAQTLSPYDCRAHVQRHFSADRMVANYLQVYQRTIRSTHPHRSPLHIPHRRPASTDRTPDRYGVSPT